VETIFTLPGLEDRKLAGKEKHRVDLPAPGSGLDTETGRCRPATTSAQQREALASIFRKI
jgi:hypothetical protein